MDITNHNLDVLKQMKVGDVADFEDHHYPSIKKEDDGFYQVNTYGGYSGPRRHLSVALLGSYFYSCPLTLRCS